jgi:hypothetical protein
MHKRPPTKAQLAGNRANAARSTGPYEDGKVSSRFNATRHNLCSNVALQSGEDREQFGFLQESEPAPQSYRKNAI